MSPSPITAAVAIIGLIGGAGVGAVITAEPQPITIHCNDFGLAENADGAALILNCGSGAGQVQIQIPNLSESLPTATIDFQTGEPTDGPESGL